MGNYTKHSQYYSKYTKLVSQSDIYIWVCLGIAHHIGFHGSATTKLQRTIIFWALDIAMDGFEDLQGVAMGKISCRAVKGLEFYFGRWVEMLMARGIRLGDLVYEWTREMMFGYMGIDSIAFFVDCFRKSGWDYLIKLILSYFEARTKDISKRDKFLQGKLEPEELLTLFVDSKEEWPMIFCYASSFVIKE